MGRILNGGRTDRGSREAGLYGETKGHKDRGLAGELARGRGSPGEQKEQGLRKQRQVLPLSPGASNKSLNLYKMGILSSSQRVVLRINPGELFSEPTTVPDIIANTNK